MMTKLKTVPELRFPGYANAWDSCSLGDIASVKHGYPFKGEHFSSEGDFIVMTPGNFTPEGDFRYQGAKEKFYADDQFPREYILSRGDLVTVMTEQTVGLIGSAVLVPDDSKFLHNQRLGLFQFIGDTDPRFLYHYLKTSVMRVAMSNTAAGSKVRHTSPKRIEKLQVWILTLPEQRKIAFFLTAVDWRIQQLSQKKALLEDYKQGVMQQLFTQALRFKDDHDNEFPDWEEKTLGEIADVYQLKTISQTDMTPTGYVVYGANEIIGWYDKYNHEKEQVAVTCRGNTCGTINLTEPFAWITGNAMVVNLDKQPTITKTFVFHSLKHADLRYLITGSGQPQITGTIKKHVVILPSVPEQTKIANFLTALDRKIESVAHQITHTQAFKKGLLQQMFV